MILANYVRAAVIGVGLASIPLGSLAQSETGNDLLQRLDAFATSNPGFSSGAGVGYVRGVADTLRVSGAVCVPERVSVGQLGMVVQKFLRDNPAQLHRDATVLTIKALMENFPCKGKP